MIIIISSIISYISVIVVVVAVKHFSMKHNIKTTDNIHDTSHRTLTARTQWLKEKGSTDTSRISVYASVVAQKIKKPCFGFDFGLMTMLL